MPKTTKITVSAADQLAVVSMLEGCRREFGRDEFPLHAAQLLTQAALSRPGLAAVVLTLTEAVAAAASDHLAEQIEVLDMIYRHRADLEGL